RHEMRGDALDGTGDIDVSESFVWLDGALGGAGAVRIAPGAAALIGGDADVEGSVGSAPLTLARALPVEGEARHRSGLIELGAAGLADDIGAIDIAPGAVRTFERFDADIAGAPGAANVLRNDGLLRKIGGGVSVADDPNLALEGGGAVEALDGELRVGGQTFGSWPPVEDAPRPGDPLIDGETLTLSAGESLDALTLDGGTLVLDGDARRERPTFVSGVVAGPGDLTLGERFDWEGGRMTGAGATRAEADAAVILGAIWDENSTPEPRMLQLDRTLTLLGDGRLEQARVRLGGTEAEPGAETPSERAGALEIAEGATLDLVGIHSDLSPSRPGAAALVNDGAIRKLGPGASDLGVHVSGEGTVAQTDADGRFHVASGGTLTLDGSEDVDHLVVDGGVLVLGGDVTLASLQLLGGGVEGAGSLDVTDALIWRSGLLSVEGGVDLLAGAQGDFGSGAPPDAPGPGADLDLATTLNLFGDAALRDGRVDLGRRPFDADLLADVTEVGRLHVRDGAELSLIGPAADVASGALGTPFLGAATGSGPQMSFLTNDEVIRREGFGRSQLSGVIQGDCAFVSDRDEPGFEIGDHGALVLDGGLAIDAVHLAGGLLSAEADVALSRLSLEDGLPTGPGDVFVSDRLEVGASSILAGPGRLVLQEGAAGLFGRARDPDAPPSSTFLELSRDLRIEGEAWFEQARVDVSGTVRDPVSAASVHSGGVVEIAPTNVAILHGREVDLRNDGENGVAPLINAGVLRRTGPGVAEIRLDYSGDGVLDLAGGALAWGRGADLAISDLAGQTELRLNGASLNLDQDASPTRLTMLDGLILGDGDGDGDLTVTDRLHFRTGGILGDGALILPAGSEALFGEGPLEFDPVSAPQLGRDVDLSGHATVSKAFLDLRSALGDPAAADVESGSTFRIQPGAMLELAGAAASLDGEAGVSSLINRGVLRKTGPGVATIEAQVDYVDEGGAVDVLGGRLRLEADGLPLA
ncbi:MAG: hypothetical protein AAF676_10050, partial [Pseudomonadota bacterium]